MAARPLAGNAGNARRLLVAGATGLVGSCLVREALADDTVAVVHALARRPLDIADPRLCAHVVDFGMLPAMPEVDEVYLALGTTIRQAGSEAAFRAVDLDANLAVARAGLAAGAHRIGVVSAMGADPRSRVFYSRVKGETEDALAALAPDTLVIARPSLLAGERAALGQPSRLGESIGIGLGRLVGWALPIDYRPVEARRVARALLASVPTTVGRRVLLSGEIQQFA